MLYTKFLMDSKFHFFQWKINFSQFIFFDEYLKIKEIEYFIHYIMFEMWKIWKALFYVNSIYFKQWNATWDVIFNSSLDLKLGFVNVGLRLYFKLFPSSQKYWKLGFVNIALVKLFDFFQFIKEMEHWDFWILAWMEFFP